MVRNFSELYCYSSRTFTILYNNVTFDVFNEKTKELIEQVECSPNDADISGTFNRLKTKYIFDYDNKLIA